MHAWRLGFKAKRQIRGREVERVCGDGGLDLFYGRLYDVGKGLQFCQGILRDASVEGVVRHFKHHQYMWTYLAADGWVADVANREDKGVKSEAERDIVDDERIKLLKGR